MMLWRGVPLVSPLLVFLAMATHGLVQAQTPDGAVFRVNSVTATEQGGPVVSMDGAGRGVILWTDYNMEPNRLVHPRIAGQRFDSRGGRIGSEFVSNEPPFKANSASGLAMQGGAEFVTFWSESFSYFARHYLAIGLPGGSPALIDESGSHVGRFDYLAGYGAGAGGDFVGVWQRVLTGDVSTDGGTLARWFDRNASPLTGEILLPDAFEENGSPIGHPLVDVVAGPNRSVLIGWTIPGFNEEYWDLHVQAYSVAGQKLGPEFLVSHNIGSPQAGMAWNPATRNFVVAWRSAEPVPGGFKERTLFQRLTPEGQSVTPQPIVVSETGGIPAAVACNVKGYCAVTWFRDRVGIVLRVIRPDGRVLPKEALVAAVPAYPNWIAYGGNGALMVVWTNDYEPSDPADIAARRLIASPGDEVCQRLGNEVRCDSGRTGNLPELSLAGFGLGKRDRLLFGDIDGDGRADPCRAQNGTWRCDLDHEGGVIEAILSFAGAGTGTPLLGDLDGNGRADACVWSAGTLRCDTARNGGAPELTLSYGAAGDVPHLADLDGDGRDDLCLWSRGLLRCDVGHDGGRSEARIVFGLPGDQLALGDFDGNGSADPCVARGGKLLCDTVHDGGEAEGELVLGSSAAPVLLGNLDGV